MKDFERKAKRAIRKNIITILVLQFIILFVFIGHDSGMCHFSLFIAFKGHSLIGKFVVFFRCGEISPSLWTIERRIEFLLRETF